MKSTIDALVAATAVPHHRRLSLPSRHSTDKYAHVSSNPPLTLPCVLLYRAHNKHTGSTASHASRSPKRQTPAPPRPSGAPPILRPWWRSAASTAPAAWAKLKISMAAVLCVLCTDRQSFMTGTGYKYVSANKPTPSRRPVCHRDEPRGGWESVEVLSTGSWLTILRAPARQGLQGRRQLLEH